jgi:hypothetical protein
MLTNIQQLDNPEADIEDAVNYPEVRTFVNKMEYSYKPLEDLRRVNRQWARPSADNQFGLLSSLFVSSKK